MKVFLLLFLALLSESRLLYAFTMIRHGARYPKQDFYAAQLTNPFQSTLSPVGMRQLYNLGTYLRADYMFKNQFLSKKCNRSQVEFFSSSLQRTQFSAYCLMYGLYPLDQGESIPSRIHHEAIQTPFTPLRQRQLKTQPESHYALRSGFQPLPVHFIDKILNKCSHDTNFSKDRKAFIAQNVKVLLNQNAVLIQKMKLIFNLSPTQGDIITMLNLYKGLQADRLLGIEIPPDYTQEDHQNMKYMYEYYNALKASGKFGRIGATLILQIMREKLNEAYEGTFNKKLSFFFFHSTSMWPIATSLNLTSAQCISKKKHGGNLTNTNCFIPTFAANIIVQLHEDDHLEKYVMIRSNGIYAKICGDKQKCIFEEFLQRVKKTEINDEHYCGKGHQK